MNPDKSVVVVLQNDKEIQNSVCIKVSDKNINVALEPDSFNTLLVYRR
jgi:hypothetical protein